MAEPEIGNWLPKGDGFSREKAKKSLTAFRNIGLDIVIGIWGIFHKRNKILIGRCGLNLIDETSEVEIDFLLTKKFWGKGYAIALSRALARSMLIRVRSGFRCWLWPWLVATGQDRSLLPKGANAISTTATTTLS
jgi:hypothetical protein